MMIVYSKEYTQLRDEIHNAVQATVFQISYDHMLPAVFVHDSKIIQDAMNDISERLAHLLEDVKIDSAALKQHKEFKEALERLGEQTEAKQMKAVEREQRRKMKHGKKN